jgi:thiol-disulfide isomerase/thioredoxin
MILTFLVLIVSCGFSPRFLVASGTSVEPQTAPQTSVDSPPTLSDDLLQTTLKTVNGKSFKLADFSKKVIVINIWATWCGPCRFEMPELSKMNREYKSRGVVFLGLAATYNEREGAKRVRDYLRIQKINYPSIWDDGTLTRPLVEAVKGRNVIPQTFVIAKGRVVKHFAGFNRVSTPGIQRAAIEEALKSNANLAHDTSKSVDCADPNGYSVAEVRRGEARFVEIAQGNVVLGSIRIFTGVERNGFALNYAKKTKSGFEISVEYGSRYYYNKSFIFICKQQKFYLIRVIVDSFDKQNPEHWRKKVVRLNPALPLEKFLLDDFMLEGVVKQQRGVTTH